MKIVSIYPVMFCMMLFSLSSNSQTYHLSVSQEPYVDLDGGIALVKGVWDDSQFLIPVGFNFTIFDDPLPNMFLLTDIVFTDELADAITPLIIAYGADLVDRGNNTGNALSPITYKLSGSTGSRVLTVEWKNAGFFTDLDQDGVSTYYVNFQLRLYEANGDIALHFGPSVTHPDIDFDAPGPTIGILEDYDLVNDYPLGEVLLLTGDPTKPTVITTIQDTYLNGTVPENTVYKFSRNTTATHDIARLEEKQFYYPNPATQYVTLKPEAKGEIFSPVIVINAMGQVVRFDQETEKIELDGLPSGIYQLLFQTPSGQATQRISLLR